MSPPDATIAEQVRSVGTTPGAAAVRDAEYAVAERAADHARAARPVALGKANRVAAVDARDLRGILAVFVAAVTSYLVLAREGLLVSLDSSTQYLPWYTYLGESLRAGRIPGWNPANFGGTPFAADPLSGWTYLPAMLLFISLPSDWAAHAIVLFHPLLAGAGTYALGRTLGLSAPGASMAAIAYACGSFMQLQSVAAQPYAGVAAWLPVGLLGIERSTRCQAELPRRIGWWSLAALAVSQAAAVWPGQGAAYASLVIGGYALVSAIGTRGRRSRFENLAWVGAHVAMPLLLATLLSAAGLLPRLEFLALSNLANGHPLEAQQVGGWQFHQWWRVLAPGYWGVGIATLALAMLGASLVRSRLPAAPLVRASLYLATVWFAALVLTHSEPTPMHAALYVLPGFERLHAHLPERIMIVAYIGPALLAGVAFGSLWTWVGPTRAALVGLAIVATLLLEVDLGRQTLLKSTWDALRVIDEPATPPSAAAFLHEKRLHLGPVRYVGFGRERDDAGRPLPYTHTFDREPTRALLVNNRALELGLEDLQGYAAIHLAAFDALLLAVNNGQSQDYHDGYVLESGLRSPLLDLLGVRYLLVPSDALPHEPALVEDGAIKIVDRPTALPRAWVVHEAIVAASSASSASLRSGSVAASSVAAAGAGAGTSSSTSDALRLIASGSVDPHHTAIVERPLSIELPGGPATPAHILLHAPDGVRAAVSLDRPGLLVVGDIYYPAWKAYVDGHPTPIVRTNAVLRGMEVPAGDHIVDLRFESDALALGCAVSTATALALMLAALASLRTRPA